jgi:transcription-repair coupling factor (superfamily II helicase)
MHAPFIEAPQLPANKQSQKWYSLPGVTAAATLYSAITQQQCFALIITKDSNETEEWLEQFKFFNRDNNQNFALLRFPDSEILPYDHFSPHPDISSGRLQTLYQLQQQRCGVCLVSASTLLARLCPVEHVNYNSLNIRVGEPLNISEFTRHLTKIGYQHRETVFEHGEFAVRGSLLDLFPMGSDTPYRIELFDNDIESLRNFDPESQRSLNRMNTVSILPAGEISLDKQAINLFRDRWHQEFTHNPDICPVYQDTLAGVSSAGIESYLPMFFQQTASLFDYLPEHSLVVRTPSLKIDIEHFINDISERYKQNSIDPTRPLLKPEKLYLSVDECFRNIKQKSQIILSPHSMQSTAINTRGEFNFDTDENPVFLIDDHSDHPTEKIETFIANASANDTLNHLLFCLSSTGRREVFIEKLKAAGIAALPIESWQEFFEHTHTQSNSICVGVAIAAFNHGATFVTTHNKIAARYSIVTEPELFGVALKPKARGERSKAAIAEASIHSLMELQVGSPIVHIDHGVGRYLGLERMPVPISPRESIEAEFLALSYAGGDKLYVPVTALHCISRYMGGDEDSAPLNKLGSESWGKAKNKAINNVHDVAAELLAIYAKRQSMSGLVHQLNEQDYSKFAEQFPFEPTADQQNAIDAVLADMQHSQPMDRLICGDVGFGKTEVAMRAAFIAITNNTQVMLLVPTTLLAQQHLQNFQDRFSDWPVRIDVLSRFRSTSEQSSVLENFNNGKIDILIGTHKLLQKDIKAAELGLVVIDEEHRFGVRQKEQLKRLCANVDLLTMTATPIPRTLNMAMSGLRDLSIITTPPARRLSVKTFVREKQNSVVKEAMLRELLRGGQVFYLHNDVKTIDKIAAELAELVPDARIAIGHGQMPERQLERVMADFYHKKFSVLLCTTIIETGIDIPNANTIIIDRADKFGLAQLHQLRGRVGRSHHQAYAYLFTPNKKSLTKDAQKRLTAISEAQDLGAGFMLATHDLEIRGAGELLGDEQSGQIHSLGYSLYLEMLEKAVAALKAGEDIDLNKPLQPIGEINLHLPALIPDDYLPDIHNRLTLYKRIANANSNSALRDLKVEMIDRFGLLTAEINNLFAVTEIKLQCNSLGITKIDAGQTGGYIEFASDTAINPIKIVSLVQSQPNIYQLKNATRLSFLKTSDTAEQRLAVIHELLATLDS